MWTLKSGSASRSKASGAEAQGEGEDVGLITGQPLTYAQGAPEPWV